VEDEDIVCANIVETYDGDEEVLGTTATETYKALIVQRALSAMASDDDNRQRHNLFTCSSSSRTAVYIPSLTVVAATTW
jgi:hypothetical protein